MKVPPSASHKQEELLELLSNKIINVFLHYLIIDEASGIREVLVNFSRCGGHLLECNCPSA